MVGATLYKSMCVQEYKKLFLDVSFRKEIWIMDPATDLYYRWLTVIAMPVFFNLIMLVTRYIYFSFH